MYLPISGNHTEIIWQFFQWETYEGFQIYKKKKKINACSIDNTLFIWNGYCDILLHYVGNYQVLRGSDLYTDENTKLEISTGPLVFIRNSLGQMKN